MALKKKITISNHYGEKIHVKIEDGEVLVHHEDATKDFVDLNYLFTEIVLDTHEVILIYASIKSLIQNSMAQLNWTKSIIELKEI